MARSYRVGRAASRVPGSDECPQLCELSILLGRMRRVSRVLFSVRDAHVVRLRNVRPWRAALSCTVASLLALAPAASGSYFSSSCESGASDPLAVSNDAGEMVVAWQRARGEERGLCFASVAMAAVGSAKAGFPSASTVSAPA